MAGIVPVVGLPGIRSVKTATHKIVFRQGDWNSDLSLGKIINGALARDWSNTGDLDTLQPGVLMGKITTGGLYAPSILGVVASAYTSGGTTLTVSAAQAVEIVRRVGASGSLLAVGPPSAAGTVASTSVTYSAVNTTTGDITVTSLGVNKIAGTFLTSTDGSGVPITFIPDGYGVKVTDSDGTNLSVPFAPFPVAGVITVAQLVGWPTDTSLQAWVRTNLSTASGGKYVFGDQF